MFDCYRRRIHYLRISVTDLCNLRCVYCMPEKGVVLKRHQEILSFEEIEETARQAVIMGIDKIRLTGGEPLVRCDIINLVERVGAIHGIRDYAITTNGVLLPRFARELKRAGINRVNISLDAIDPGRYREITRGGRVEEALAGLEAALAAGFDKVKINCVIRESPEEPDARAVAGYGAGKGVEVRFIREMDTRSGRFWPVIGGDSGNCASCNRLRLSSDGYLYPCLFSDIRFSVRELGAEAAFLAAVGAKPRSGRKSENEFYSIGG